MTDSEDPRPKLTPRERTRAIFKKAGYTRIETDDTIPQIEKKYGEGNVKMDIWPEGSRDTFIKMKNTKQ